MSRFYVAELTGYSPFGPTGRTDYRGTSVMVLDGAYCHRVVWQGRTERRGGRVSAALLRADAAARCAELNAEDAPCG